MTPSAKPNDSAERDLGWFGYSGWAMMPSFLVCTAISIVLLMGGWFFDSIRGLGEQVGSAILFQITFVIWIVQLLRWFYRGATYTYRLTDRHLFIDRGFLYNPFPPIALERIHKVTWKCDPIGFFFAVGKVCVWVEGQAESVELMGVLRPAALAEQIETLARERRQRSNAPPVNLGR